MNKLFHIKYFIFIPTIKFYLEMNLYFYNILIFLSLTYISYISYVCASSIMCTNCHYFNMLVQQCRPDSINIRKVHSSTMGAQVIINFI